MKILDPICDMVVSVDVARERGLTLEYPDREYAFCSAGCQERFAKNPKPYIPKVEAWLAAPTEGAHGHSSAAPVIDAGIRAWYDACRCCLSDAYPQVVETLDRERAAVHHAPAEAGICETAEGHEPKST